MLRSPGSWGGSPETRRPPVPPKVPEGSPRAHTSPGAREGSPAPVGTEEPGGVPDAGGPGSVVPPPAPRPALHPPAGRPPPPLPSCATGGDHGPGRARAGAAGSAGCGGVGGGLGGSPLCPLGGPSAGRCGAERCGAASRSLSHAQPRAPAHRRYCLRLKRTSRGVPASRRRYGDGESAPPQRLHPTPLRAAPGRSCGDPSAIPFPEGGAIPGGPSARPREPGGVPNAKGWPANRGSPDARCTPSAGGVEGETPMDPQFQRVAGNKGGPRCRGVPQQ